MENLTHGRIVLFDGVCNLCNSFVIFIIRHDRGERFRFAALQSGFVQSHLLPHYPEIAQLDTVLYYRDGKMYDRSTAALLILRDLGGWPSLLYGAIIVPQIIRDRVYNLIAKGRYRLFGRREQCMLPTPDLKRRFFE